MIDPHSLMALAHIVAPALDTSGPTQRVPVSTDGAGAIDSDMPMLVSMGMHMISAGPLLDFLRLFHDCSEVMAELFSVINHGTSAIDLNSGPSFVSGLSNVVAHPEWPSQIEELRQAISAQRVSSPVTAGGRPSHFPL